jgi:hypothetical protein
MVGGAELPPWDSAVHEPLVRQCELRFPTERNGASSKSRASKFEVCLDNAVVVIDGMTPTVERLKLRAGVEKA